MPLMTLKMCFKINESVFHCGICKLVNVFHYRICSRRQINACPGTLDWMFRFIQGKAADSASPCKLL